MKPRHIAVLSDEMNFVNDEHYRRLLYWMDEREKIRVAKERGVQRDQWTRDAILHAWRFCNVNRCDDRETRWIHEHIVRAHADSPVLWFNLVIARFINWSPTLARLGYFDAWNRDRFVSTIDVLQQEGAKVYTGAYMVPAGPARVPKHGYLANVVFSKFWSIRHEAPQDANCVDWDNFLGRAPLVGDFLRNQVITDLRYTYHLRDAKDWETFILPGPGTQRGLNRLHGLPLKQRWSASEASEALQSLRTLILSEGPRWRAALRDINNLSNCMCELDKYCRVLNGEGKPRARYVPREELS